MSLTTTQGVMRDAVRRTANVVAFTDKHPDTYVNELINRGLGRLSQICRTTNPKFQPIASTTITADGVNTMFGLPATFRSLLSVEYEIDGFRTWLDPLLMSERPALVSTEVTASSNRATGYIVMGQNIELLPRPPKDHKAHLWFATSVTQFALTGADAASVDVMDRLDSYVIWFAAREIAMEREDWARHDRLTTKMQEFEPEIRILARSIDLSQPSRVTQQEASGRNASPYRRRLSR